MNQPTIPGTSPCKIIANEKISSYVHYLTFERPYEFEAGQVLSLTLNADIPPRLYSIASGTDEHFIGILFDVKPEGTLTTLLAQLSAGDTVFVSPPYGSFIGNSEPAVWIATGTGIAPFISMARSGLANNKLLIQGARTIDGFYFSDLFRGMEGLEYVRCSSKDSNDNIYSGRLTSYLRETPSLPLNEKYYLCGNPLMVNEVRDLLIERGIPFDNILSEIFF
ncbi:FAD-binding oxidoreductase [uncultured Acetobacteroides sp.]|uniref:ferredoxin--NADP reductase n=1 Tax=uncultured Acetobacteroides sp. TaxID=1760811 RepID=UPI0029F5C492|nr:FAD-binding oxidoreductase [uncultured Acetobacteroides sp.]